jgi:hypothetical protein
MKYYRPHRAISSFHFAELRRGVYPTRRDFDSRLPDAPVILMVHEVTDQPGMFEELKSMEISRMVLLVERKK